MIWNSWTLPVLTSNGIMGGPHFAVAASSMVWTDRAFPYEAFNGTLWHGNSSLPQWIAWYSPEPIRIEEIMIQNRVGTSVADTCAPTRYKIQASNDYKNWIDLTSFIGNNIVESAAWHTPIRLWSTRTYHYFRLYITARNSSSSYTAIQTIKLKAFTPEEEIREMSYWLGWDQPCLTSNSDYGLVTADSYLPDHEPWKASDHRLTRGWATYNRAEGTWIWHFPKPLRLRQIVFRNRRSPENDPEALFQQCQFYANNKEYKIGEKFQVSKSKEQVNIQCNGEIVDALTFHKVGGRYSGIGELLIEADEYKRTGELIRLSYIAGAYTNGHPISQIYSEGKLIWDKSQALKPADTPWLYVLEYPFDNVPETLLNEGSFVLDEVNQTISSNTEGIHGSSVYGYIEYTPEVDAILEFEVSNDSEANYDFGGVYVGDAIYKPTRDQIRAGTTDGKGLYLVNTSGEYPLSLHTYGLEAGRTYFINFFYAKDGSVNYGTDSFKIHSLKIRKWL